jgi:Fe-Mn family superoxide dismutase
MIHSNLPYDYDALEPYVSEQTLRLHYDKHHGGYVDKLNKLIDGTEFSDLSLEELICRARDRAQIDILNNAQQAWNHAFLWESMAASGETSPDGRIKDMIENSFGNVATFKEQFRNVALSLFGSGWVWLVQEGDELRILPTGNADSPVGTHLIPLLVLDVWEHAYYLDYQNERARYVDAFLNKMINWKFAAANLRETKASKAA